MSTQEEIWKSFPFKRGKFNGKGKAHWQNEADKLVVEMLLRASIGLDRRSLIGALAAERLFELACNESPDLLEEVVAERGRSIEGFAVIMSDILG